MSWQNRILAAAYNAPSGDRFEYEYEDLSKSFRKKGTAFEFTGTDGTYVQSLGKTSRRIPLRIYLSGENHDLQADAFDSALGQDGIGVLEHPVYGTINVVPLGDITRNNALKRSANESVIEVTFFETIDSIYPFITENTTALIVQNIDTFNAAMGNSLAEQLEDPSSFNKAATESFYSRNFDVVTDELSAIARIQADIEESVTTAFQPLKEAFDNTQSVVGSVQSQFDSIRSSIELGLDVLITET